MNPVERAFARIAEVDRPEVWITLRPQADVQADLDAATGPLAGRLLAVKDNIAVAGLPRTAACPALTELSTEDAPAVARLKAAGAVVIGTTNLDQFATGLVGTRSPFGAVRSAADPSLISGGSSSGSAVAVALGIADLALGTDTAGSGRVPAALQGIVGIKPTRGLVPTRGVLPACRSLDCVTVFARTLDEAELAMAIMSGPDDRDPQCRSWPPDAPLAAVPVPTVGVPRPEDLAMLPPEWQAAFWAVAKTFERTVTIDLAPFLEAGSLLYGGAFVAERYAAVGELMRQNPDACDPTVAALVLPAADIPAHQLVTDTARLDELKLAAMAALGHADVLLLPTTTSHPSLADVEADPIGVNAGLGRFTAFANLLDLCAVSVPAPGVGVSVIGRTWGDRVVADVARSIVASSPELPVAGIPLVVVGAHLSGMVLNSQLRGRGARLLREVRTAPTYDLFALATEPPKPGLVRRTDGGGTSIVGELWDLPPAGLASLLAALPTPMTFGKVTLDDGTQHVSFLCEPAALEGATDISHLGGWRAFVAS